MASAAVSQASSRSQRTLAFRGALLLVFGLVMGAMLLLAFRVPDITTKLMIIVLSAFVIVDGLATLFEAAGVASRRGAWALLVLKALIGFAAAVAIVLRPGVRSVTIFAWWASADGNPGRIRGADVPRAASLAAHRRGTVGPVRASRARRIASRHGRHRPRGWHLWCRGGDHASDNGRTVGFPAGGSARVPQTVRGGDR